MKYLWMINVVTVLVIGMSGAAKAEQVQRSIVIEPYPEEKLEKLEKNIGALSAPVSELSQAIADMESAKKAYQENTTPLAKARLNEAMAIAYNRISHFVDAARSSKVDLTMGFEDLADYLEVNASSMEVQSRRHPHLKATAEQMREQAAHLRTFSQEYREMVQQVETIGDDLAGRSAGWVASSRISGLMSEVYGAGGIDGVYTTMAHVVDAMAQLKAMFRPEELLGGSATSSAEQNQAVDEARTEYQSAIDRYYEEP